MRALRPIVFLGLCAALLTSQARAGGREPGSRLIFPVHDSRTAFTVVSVSNMNSMPATPFSAGGSTVIQYAYYNVLPSATDPLRTDECNVFKRNESLTPADTISLLSECHNLVGPDGNAEGYLIVTAQDPDLFNTAWAFDYLVGSETVITATGGMYCLNAVAFEADPNGVLIPGDQIAYEPFSDLVIMDTFVAAAQSQLALTAMMSNPRDVATVLARAWNDNEFPLSLTFQMGCWFNQPLSTISDLFAQDFLASTPHDPSELDVSCNGDGTLETGWVSFDCLDVTTVGGLTVDADGVPLLGAVTAGATTLLDTGHNLWEMGDENVVDP